MQQEVILIKVEAEAITCVCQKNHSGRAILTATHLLVGCTVSSTAHTISTMSCSRGTTTEVATRSTVNQLRVLSATYRSDLLLS